ncbi:aminoglycoside phosphotransferase family protein [Alteraurantiacibacter aquimixticola]|uniref:Aminoglycoside phosphotransferase n=1 Tax=Alteraurantiacibacter aquimixticola TaxID=2489173 RepID=A0A4T3F439_9SPHN|nr:phosphotransferase [Alteraurantiacibacter aquimixticola]TIX52033.1 aminoglycoside phosphotransferase [Alteraurantiacibacter aquimixticola]
MSAELPAGVESFLEQAGWGDADIVPLPGDASFRRYFRIHRGDETALLMDAPPPHEDPRPFLHVGHWLIEHGHHAPAIHAEDAARGLVLIEDFGTDRMRDWLDENPQAEEATYVRAIDTLVELHKSPPGPFEPYDMPTYLRETRLFTEWFCPAAGMEVDEAGHDAAWEEALTPLLDRQQPGVTVLRDYHAENIMLLPGGGQGLIDFQDALIGHPAYDVVSLLQDARRDVTPALEAAMLEHYKAATGVGDEFAADYALLGAQRNAKIVGIFTRLWKRDAKPRYLSMIPRVWEALERDLAHPALAPVASWFDANVPAEWRERRGGGLG